MRILFAVPLVLVAAGCNVSKDAANNTVSLTINQEQAANAAADVGNQVQNVAQDVGNEAKELGNKAKNTDVDVNVNTNVKTDNTAENKAK